MFCFLRFYVFAKATVVPRLSGPRYLAPETIEIVGGASNFMHVDRLLPARLSHDRGQKVT